jgi:hypothetical protein
MRAVNLVPPELRARVPGDGDPRVAFGVCGGLALLLVMVIVAVSYSNKATTLNDEAAALQAEASRHVVQAKPVQSFNDFASLAQSRTLLVGGLSASRFPWGTALYNLSRSLPADVTLDNIKAATAESMAAGGAPAAGGVAQTKSVPTLSLSGCTSGWIGYSRLTVWLKSMPGVDDVESTQTSNGGPVSTSSDSAGARTKNCGPSPLKFAAKVIYQPREVNLVGLPKIESAAGATGASGAVATPAPAAATATGGG